MPSLAESLDASSGMMLDVDPPSGSRPLSFRPEDSAIRLQRAAVAAREMDARRAAEAAALAERNRVDPQAAYSAITNAPQSYGTQRILDDPKWRELAKKTPKLAEFLSDPVNLKIAENDIESLSGLEYAWARVKQTGEAMQEGVGQQLAQRRQSNALFKFMMHTAEPDLFQVSKADLRDLEESNLVSGVYDTQAAIFKRQPTARAAMATTNAITQMTGALGYGLAGYASGAAVGGLVGARGGAPGAAAGAGVGGTVGRNAAVFYDSFKMNAAGDFREFASLKDEAGQPINQRVAAYAAITSGLVNAALDAYVVDKVTGAIAPGVADKLRKLGGGRVVGDLLKRPGFRDELLRYGKDVAKLSALEVGTEGAQRAISLVMRELAKADAERNMGAAPFASPTLTEPLTDDQGRTVEPSYLSQIGNEMQEALWGMPGAIGVMRAPRSVMAIRHQQNITASQEELKALDEANAATEQSATRQASPEAFNRLMHILGGKNASDAVHIDADAVTRLFQNEGIDPAQGVRETFGESLVRPYEEALALGQSFRVPTQQFATEIAGTEMYGKLRESGGIHIRPEGLTEADIKLIDANSEAETARLEQLAADIASGKVTETPVQQVYRDIQAQLTGLNRYDQATINAYASQQAAWFGTLAGRMKREGVTAQTLYEPYRLRIANEMPRIIQRVDRARFDERLDPLLEGVRAGKVPTEKEVRGPSLLDFVLENGGLVDSGGELAAMDANAGRVGKNTIVRKTGRTLDAMAEVAHEAGYLKSRDIQELLDGIAGELKGQPVYAPGNENADLMTKRQQMLDLQEALGGLGLDIGQYSNAELRDALFRAGQESGGEAGRLNHPVTAGHEWEMGQRAGLFDLKPIEAVLLTGNELGRSDEEIKTAAMAEMYRIRKLPHTPLSNEDTGWSLSVSKEGASKIAKNRDQSLSGLQSVAGISDLVRRAVRAESHPDYKRSNPDLQAIHRLYAPVEIGGRLYRAKLTVRDYAGKASGNKTTLHALESIEIENAPLGTSPAPLLQSVTGDESAQPTTARKVSIADLLEGATDADGKPFSATGGGKLSQQARGHLSWNAAREFTLTLTGKANFSTFLHESAHFYLEVYRDLVKQGDLPQQMQDDWQAITRYLAGYADKAIPEIRVTLESLRQQKDKTTEPADLRSLTSAIAAHEKALELAEASGGDAFMRQVAEAFGDNVQNESLRAVLVTPFHEAWARSMEGYFMEGKAPSLELMGAFSRFRVWMKQIYHTLTGLNVKLTDEVRGVMDRMFAMDDEIAEAREMQNAKPLFASLAAAGMTKAQYDAYLKVVALADDQIEAEALAMMGSAEKQRLRQVAAKRDEVRNEVENELNRQKTQMLIHFLRTGNFRDGHDMGVYVHPMKLDRQTIIDRKGPEFLKALPKGMYRDASQATESERQWIVDPDGMAMLFGYSSGDEMLMDLANERITSESKRREAIEAETEARLRQYFPDVTTSGESADIAMKAVHHATRADVLAREAELLADRIGEKATPDKIIQAYAVQKIAETPVFELQTGVYLRAASKAANAAFAALNNGDYKTALLEKQRERVNFHLYNEAMRAQEATAKIGDYLGSFDKKSKRQTIGKAGGTEYALISGGDVSFHPTQKDAEAARVKSGNPRAFIEQRNRFLDQIDNLRDRHEIGEHYTKGDLRAMESMESFTRQMAEEGGEAPLVESWMFNNVPWQRLSFAQYIALASAIRSIEMLARNRYNLSRMQKGMDLEQVTTEIADAIRATGDSHKQAESFNRSPTDIAGEALADVVAVHAKAEFIMELLDGGPNGPMYRHFMKPAQEAEVLENDRIAEMRQAVAKIFSVYTLAESARLGTGLSRLQVSVPELNTSMNREGLLALALNWGNEYNRMAVIEGQADRNSAWTTENVEKALNAHLTDKDWDVVEQVWALVNSYWPEVKALEERVSGVAPEKVEASPFQLKSGRVMAGGYYPLTYAPWNARQAMQDAKTMLSGGIVESGLGSRAMTRHGHTQERTNSGGKPVMLTLDGLDRHLTSVIHDLTYRELLTDWNRILNNKSVRDAIAGTQGVAMYKQLQLWMRRIANDRQPMDTFVHQVFNRLNAGVSVMLLGLSLGNAMMQQSGYLLAVPTLGGRSVAQGMIRFWTNPMGTLKFIRERSGFMRQRDITFSREVRDAMKDLNPGDRAVNAVRRVAFWLTAKSQMTVDAATWMAAYERALRGDAGPNMAKGSEADAVDYADSVVRKTQSGGSAKDLATIQGQNPVFKALTPLYGYFSVLFNQFLLAKRQAGRDFRQGEYLRAGDRIISNVIFLWLAPFLLSELLAMRGPDDDEEWGDWLKKKGGDMIAYPFMSVIGVNWFANYYAHPERGLGNMPSFGAMKTMAQALESALDIGLQPFTDDDITDHQDVENIALGLGFATATPVKGIYNLTETFVMWAADEYEPQSMQELMRSAMRGVPKDAYAGE